MTQANPLTREPTFVPAPAFGPDDPAYEVAFVSDRKEPVIATIHEFRSEVKAPADLPQRLVRGGLRHISTDTAADTDGRLSAHWISLLGAAAECEAILAIVQAQRDRLRDRRLGFAAYWRDRDIARRKAQRAAEQADELDGGECDHAPHWPCL